MGKTTITKEQAEKLMKAATREVEQTLDKGTPRMMISLPIVEVRRILGGVNATEAQLIHKCGDAFIRFNDDARVHLDHTVLTNIAGQGLAR